VFFKFNFKVTFNNKYIYVVILYLQMTQHVAILIPRLITVEFLLFIKSQFTTDAQNFLHLNLEHV